MSKANGTTPPRAAVRARDPYSEIENLADRFAALADEADKVIVLKTLMFTLGDCCEKALSATQTFFKEGQPVEYPKPDHNAVARYIETACRYLVLDPDELIERSEKVRRAFERGRKAA